ncbi:MAG: hypothetical protein U9N77_08130 [Thermodesulfobacteriota bacterium]|nr:hypothetical protein [Thermodesulfobacteriota bacterium]
MKTTNIISLICFLAIVMAAAFSPVQGDVLFVHDYTMDEYLLGQQKTQILFGYTKEKLYINKNLRYTGSWMKRIFGKEKQERETTHILLDKNIIREFDWFRSRITNYPLEKLCDVEALKEAAKKYTGADEILAKRYKVKKPEFFLEIMPETIETGGYPCTHVKAELKLVTEDIKKKAKSITIVTQDLWVSKEVPGFNQYRLFHEKLAKRVGLESQRLGTLTYILRYWQGSLAPIREKLERVEGYPVKSIISITGAYIENIDSDAPKENTLEIKKEIMILADVNLDKIDINRFNPDAETPFGEITVK